MADKTRQIGGLHESTNEKGTLYKLILFINSADATTFTPTPVGKPPVAGETGTAYNTQIVAIVPAGILPTACYIYDFEKRPVGDHWIFTILACSTGYDWGKSGGGSVSGSVSNRSLSPKGQVLCKHEWWGITQWQYHYLFKDWQVSAIITPPPKVYDNSRSASANDDLVFLNATSGAVGTATMCEYLTPFGDGTWILANAPITWVDKNIPTEIYTVKLYKNIGDVFAYINFKGTNGAWQSGITPTGYTTTAMWRAVDQTVMESMGTLSGTKQDYLERVMELVPIINNTALRWDTAKNGGLWTW